MEQNKETVAEIENVRETETKNYRFELLSPDQETLPTGIQKEDDNRRHDPGKSEKRVSVCEEERDPGKAGSQNPKNEVRIALIFAK